MLDENESLLFFNQSMFDDNDNDDKNSSQKETCNWTSHGYSDLKHLLNRYNCSNFLDDNENLLFFTDEILSSNDNGNMKKNRLHHNKRIIEKTKLKRRIENIIDNCNNSNTTASATPNLFREKLIDKIKAQQDEYSDFNGNNEESRDDRYSRNDIVLENRMSSNFNTHRQHYYEMTNSSYKSYNKDDDIDNDDDESSTEVGLNSIGSYSVPSYKSSSNNHPFIIKRKSHVNDDNNSNSDISPSTLNTAISQQQKVYNENANTMNQTDENDVDITYSFSFEENVEDDDFFSLGQNSNTSTNKKQHKIHINNSHHQHMNSTNTKQRFKDNNDKISSYEDFATTPTTTSCSSSTDEQFYVINR